MVILAVAVIVGVKLSASPKSGAVHSTTANSGTISQVTGVPAAALDAMGKGSASVGLTAVKGGTPLADNGKPVVFYMGAEYCPFCAAQRWPLIVALSRFGTFSGLSENTSAANDSYPDTPTFSFHGAAYTSDYLSLQTREIEAAHGVALEQLTPAQIQIVQAYDKDGSYPFVDFGNSATMVGASYDPAILAGKTQAQVAAALADPSSDIAKAVLGNANQFTAQICALTNNKPANVCTSTAATAFAGTGNAQN